MAKEKKRFVARQLRTKELDKIREDLGPEVGDELRRAVRLATSVPRLIAEIDRLRLAVEARDARLAKVAEATKRPTKARRPRKVKDPATGEEKVPDSTDEKQLAIVGADPAAEAAK